MSVRAATEADRETLFALWDEWQRDGGPPPWVEHAREGTQASIDRAIREGVALVWEENGEVGGFACGLMEGARTGDVTELYVREEFRRHGVGARLLAAVVARLKERGAEFVTGGVAPDNADARRLYERAGFRTQELRLVADVETLERALSARREGSSFGAIHIQSDDVPAVERAVREFVPRLPGRSRGSVVTPPRNGWIAVYDELCDRDRAQLRRLSRELSDRLGAVVLALGVEDGAVVRFVLFERGRVMDEYLSVQEYYGPLPPGEVVSLAANPTLVARLTGSDAAAVRAAAVHAGSPDELPPAAEIADGIARAVGVTSGVRGYGDAVDVPGVTRIDGPGAVT